MDDPDEARPTGSSPIVRSTRIQTRRAVVILFLLAGIGESFRRWGPAVAREYQLQRAISALDAGRFEEAASTLELLIEGKPRETRARLALARAYRRQGRITEAEETLQRAVELGLPIEQARAEHDQLKAGRSSEPTDR